LLFSTQDANTEDAAPNEDAPNSESDAAVVGPLPVARFQVAADCASLTFELADDGSTPGSGILEEFRWKISQGGDLLTTIAGAPQDTVVPEEYVVGGAISSFTIAPALFSPPLMLSVNSVVKTKDTEPSVVYQTIPRLIVDEEYEVSFVARSIGPKPGSFRVQFIDELPPFGVVDLNEEVTTGELARRITLPFVAGIPLSDGDSVRLQFTFDTSGVFAIDNVRLKHLSEPKNTHLNNGDFSMGIEDWQTDGNASSSQMITVTPDFLSEVTVALVVTNSEGRQSAVVQQTIDSLVCK
tara:strand:+ start:24206 stop:25093 length:888 start_codon:yes stop_codon:yes gene_type:complete